MQGIKMKNGSPLCLETASFILVLLVHVLCLVYLQDFLFFGENGLRLAHVILSAMPVICSYLAIRFFLPSLVTAVLISGTVIILSVIHFTKYSLTKEALSWSDLTAIDNFSIIAGYLKCWHIFIIVAIMLSAVLSFLLAKSIDKHKFNLATHVGLLLIPIPFTFYSYFDDSNYRIEQLLDTVKAKYGINYIAWDWNENVKDNGLMMHLVHTSKRKLPDSSSVENRLEFNKLLAYERGEKARPKQIIFISGEAFWFDENNFKTLFQPLNKLGFKNFRSISPVYGGGTVNASFEILTGLPSVTDTLQGIIYQEYAELMADKPHTLPQYLKSHGYSTVFIHNHNRKFWKRHLIVPKFGFDTFISIEDMKAKDKRGFADDAILYNSALNQIKSKKGEKLFLYLVTVYSHGPYKAKNDFGERDYKKRLSLSIQRFAKFVKKARKIAPDALIVLYGDHKPSLNKYFYENNVIPKDQFHSQGDKRDNPRLITDHSREVVGDVPVFIKYRDDGRIDGIISEANGLPLYCMVQRIDEELLSSGVPAFAFSKKYVCSQYKEKGYGASSDSFPDWLYSLSLFEPDMKR